MKYKMSSKRSILAQKLKKMLSSNYINSDPYDLYFIFNNKRDSTASFVVDFTSYSKRNDIGFDYGFPKIKAKKLSIPGCSVLGILYTLESIKCDISNIKIDVDFPLSAMKQSSPNRIKVQKEKTLVLDRRHYHQDEIENYLKTLIHYKTIISNRESNLKINIKFKSKERLESLEKTIKKYYKSQNIIVSNKVEENKIKFNIKKEEDHYMINLELDNLGLPLWHALECLRS